MALKRKKTSAGSKAKSRSVAKKSSSPIKSKKAAVLLHDDREKKISKKSVSKSQSKASSPKRKVTVSNKPKGKIESQPKELTKLLIREEKSKTPFRREPVKEYQFYNEIYRIADRSDSKPAMLKKDSKLSFDSYEASNVPDKDEEDYESTTKRKKRK